MQVNDSDETSAQVAAAIARLAAESFARHEVKHIGPGEWLCKRRGSGAYPGSGAYHFYVLSRPGMLVVWGDLGEWVLRMSSEEPVSWAERAVESPGYLFEKVQAAGGNGKDAFYPSDAKEWLRQHFAGSDNLERYETIRSALQEREEEWDVLTHEMAMEVFSEHGMDDMSSIGVAPSPRSWWLLEALKWFTAHRSAGDRPQHSAGLIPGEVQVLKEIGADLRQKEAGAKAPAAKGEVSSG